MDRSRCRKANYRHLATIVVLYHGPALSRCIIDSKPRKSEVPVCLTQTFTAAESLVRRSGNLDALCRHRQSVRLDSHWLNTEDVTTLLSFTRHAHMYGPFHVTLTPLMEGCSGCTVSLVPLPVLVCRSTLGHTPAYTKLLRLMPVRSSLDTDLSPSVSLLPTVRSATEWREKSRGAHRANHHRFLFFPQALHGGGGGGAVIVSMHTVPKVIARGTSVQTPESLGR